jgi:dTDP-4-dehydrorhamnose 3,5-epimerase
MNVEPTPLADVLLIRPTVYGDERGYFLESFNQREFAAATSCAAVFVQDNQSRSIGGVLRGLHYQVGVRAQGKLVRVLSGEIFDVAVDLRRSSPQFGHWTAVTLNANEHTQLWIPEGFAHGFLVLSDSADVLYKTTDYYSPADERSIRYDDPSIGITWPEGCEIVLSSRDAGAGTLADAEVFA